MVQGRRASSADSSRSERRGDLCQARSDARTVAGRWQRSPCDDPVRLRLHPGRQGPEGPARRQGRQPRRDDEARPAGAARVHHHHRGLPGVPGAGRRAERTAGAGDDGAASSGGQRRPPAGRPARPAAGECPFRGEVLDARDDGDGAEHRAERCQRQGSGRGIRRRAVRLGFLPAAAADVRQDRAGDAGRGVRRRAGQGQVGQGRHQRPRPGRRRPASRWSTTFKDGIREHSGHEFPQHPREQLDMAINAVFDSWNTDRARLYRRRERIPQNLGTAVNICTMVFGNLGETSGTGVAFTRDPASGQTGAYGDYLANAQGEDVVAGIRNTLSLDDLREPRPGVAQAADQGDAPAGDALPGPVRHRVHHRARQAVDAADPGRQAHRGGGVPDRRPARRRAVDHHGRGAVPGHRRRNWRS